MNKNLKVISSLAMAGILAATGISTVSAATTKSLGVYRKVVEGKAIVPYVLEKASDKVDVKDLNSELGVTLSSGTVVKTGTTFNKAGEPHTVVVYGDVKDDGKVNVNDVTTLVDAVANGTKLDEFKKEAADVRHDGKVNVNDITTLVGYIANGDALNIELEDEKEPEVKYDYTLTVNGNNIVNNVNGAQKTVQGATVGCSTITVTPKNGSFTGAENFTGAIYLKAADGTYGSTAVSSLNSIAIQAAINENYAILEDVDLSTIADGTHDGTYKLQIKKANKVVGEVEFEVNTDTTKMSADVSAAKMTASTAAVSIKIPEEAKVTKVYCLARTKANSATPATKSDLMVDANLATVPNTTVTGLTDEDTLDYVLVNEYGNVSDVKTVVIPKLGATAPTAKLTNITATGKKFTITSSETLAQNREIVVTLYKDNKAIYSETVKVATEGTSVEVTNLASKISEVGTYTLKAYLAPTADDLKSAEVDSAVQLTGTTEDHLDDGKIIISKLVAVSGITYDATNKKITWTDNTNKNVLYEVTVKKASVSNNKVTYSKDTSVTLGGAQQATASTTTPGVKEIALNGLTTDNTCYKIEVVAKDKDSSVRVINSDVATSDEVYTLTALPLANTPSPISSTEVKLTVGNKLREVVGLSTAPTYDVEIHKIADNGTDKSTVATKAVNFKEVKNTSGVVTGHEAVVDGLTTGGKYTFILITKLDNKSVSADESVAVEMPATELSLNGLTVDKTLTAPVSGKIYVNGTHAYIGTTEVENTTKYSANYQALLNGIVAKLGTGDQIVSVSDSKIELNLQCGNSETFALGEVVEGKELVLSGNNAQKAITIENSKLASKVTLNNGVYGVPAKLSEDVVLNGAEVFSGANLEYTLKANKVNTMDGVKVTATNDTKIKEVASTGSFEVVPTSSGLTFESKKATLAISVNGTGKNIKTHSGNITIVNEGNVTLTPTNANITGKVNATITNGTLTGLGDAAFVGEQKVTLINKASHTSGTIATAKLATSAPFITTSAITIPAEAYTAETVTSGLLVENSEKITLQGTHTAADAATFINGLGLVAGDIIEVANPNASVIKITVKGDRTYNVPGLQE